MSQPILQKKYIGNKGSYFKLEKIISGQQRALYLVKEEEKEQKYIMKKQSHMKEGEEKLIQYLISNKMEYLTNYYDFFNYNKSFYTIQEYCAGGDLRNFIKKQSITLMDIYQIVLDVCKGIKQLNSLNMFHRDIKPENIVIQIEDVNKFKLCDYGEIRLEQDANKTQGVGTPAYQAPELLKKGPYDKRVDIWSLGVIIYELFEHVQLFDDDLSYRIQYLIDSISQEALNDKIENSQVDISIKPILKKILSKDPNKRPSIDEIQDLFSREMEKLIQKEATSKLMKIIENSIGLAEKWISMLETKVNQGN